LYCFDGEEGAISLTNRFREVFGHNRETKRHGVLLSTVETESYCRDASLLLHIITTVECDPQNQTKKKKTKKKMMKLIVYADRMSQPSRAVIIFCK